MLQTFVAVEQIFASESLSAVFAFVLKVLVDRFHMFEQFQFGRFRNVAYCASVNMLSQ